MPHLVSTQLESFERFKNEYLRELFAEISPIQDFTGKNLELHFEVPDDAFDEPKYTEEECREQDRTYQVPLRVRARLHNKQTGEIKEMVVYMGDFPLMTRQGTFIYNGAERVVVSQLVRSPGVYFSAEIDPSTGRRRFGAKLIPKRGAWLEFETSNQSVVNVKIDRKRKLPVTTFLRAIEPELSEDAALLEAFADVDSDPEHGFIEATIEDDRRDGVVNTEEALIRLYGRLRPGDPATVDNARSLIEQTFFEKRRYDLGPVGRYKLNKRLELETEETTRTLEPNDLVAIVREIVDLNVTQGVPDHIDHLGNRRVRAVGELLADQFRVGLLRMERVIKERMSIQNAAEATPSGLINTRPVTAAVKEFFGGSQLSQFMDQANPMAELAHKRRLSAMGPGGLSRERAGFDVRDVHYSHYGRVCPIETPEGPNIGLINTLATLARVNSYGFIETPYRRVLTRIPARDAAMLVGRTLVEPVTAADGAEPLAQAGDVIDAALAETIGQIDGADKLDVRIRPVVTNEIEYLAADEEERHTIAEAKTRLNDANEIVLDRVSVRRGPNFFEADASDVEYLDSSPQQIVSLATAMIPFLEHDDANRALMGANMQRQAVPLITPEAPLVATGMERASASDSGHMVHAVDAGSVMRVTANEILVDHGTDKRIYDLHKTDRAIANGDKTMHPIVAVNDTVAKGQEIAKSKAGQTVNAKDAGLVVQGTTRKIVIDEKKRPYRLRKFDRSNTATCISQRPVVAAGEMVTEGQPIAESMATSDGMIALGQNIVVAFMFWEGGNYEDAIVVSERLLKDDVFTSIHIEKYEVEARDTKLGAEEITRDIPNQNEEALRNLDDTGVVYVGAEVGPDDVLVGKITPKGETELSGEDRLLRAIFGRDAREVKDTSKHVPAGEYGRVIDVRRFSAEDGDDLQAGVTEMIRVSVASKRKLMVGDKMAGRHGNKGVISMILPEEDMPYLADGTPVDIILNPLGVASRMNVGQTLETHLGWAADKLGFRAISPVFDSADEEDIAAALEEAELPADGKAVLYDGRTGEPFDQDVTVGVIYMMKLGHMVDDKIHARSTGPYSLITQQPLGGKAQMGGQRFGEMEVWALEAYGAAHTLQEMLTVKSDDILGRVKTYEAIVKGETILEPGIPESFRVLVKELQSLGVSVDILDDAEEEIALAGEHMHDQLPDLDGINIQGREYRL
ncbi:MAG: DNA-directed RNA polymerase subunit beta [Chloroflexota bacterium]|nr:DNA-directed RNA polymerase subunit beta [Chloroflexota bacterium]